jgi:hypothetical protein
MADYTAKIDFILTRGFGNVSIGCLAIKRNMSRNIESVDTMESQVVEKLYGSAISGHLIFSPFMTGKELGAVVQQGGEVVRKVERLELTLQDVQRMCSRGPTIRSCNSCVELTTMRRAC